MTTCGINIDENKEEKAQKCIKCSIEADFTPSQIGPICRSHFIEIIEKRVRKDLRLNNPVEKGSKVLFLDDDSKEFKVGESLFKDIIKQLPVEIEVKKTESSNVEDIRKIAEEESNKYEKIIIPWNLEKEAEVFLNSIFTKTKIKHFPENCIKLLKSMTEEEISIFAEIKKFKAKEQKKSDIRIMIDAMEAKYPGYKFSLLKSIEQLSS